MPLKLCNQRCEGCAYTEGAAANSEVKNHLIAMLAVFGPFPFYCHDSMEDWRKQSNHIQRSELREKGIGLCTGWLESVKDLAATGYYKDNPIITKCLAISAVNNVNDMLASDDDEDKGYFRDLAMTQIKRLAKKRKRY
jgi:hypothetical protein